MRLLRRVAEQTQSPHDVGVADALRGPDAAVERLPEQEALRALGSGPAGLSSEAAQAALERYGPNRLPELRRRSPLWRFLAQFGDFFAILLEVAGAITLATYLIHGGSNNLKVAVAIFAVVLLNAVIGFTQEYRAERTAEALKRLLPAPRPRAARRDAGRGRRRGARPGRRRPARRGRRHLGRLPPASQAADLATNDAALTGESRTGAPPVGAGARGRPADPGAQPRLRGHERGLGDRSRRRVRHRGRHRVRAHLPARGLGPERAEPAAARGRRRRPARRDRRGRARRRPARRCGCSPARRSSTRSSTRWA